MTGPADGYVDPRRCGGYLERIGAGMPDLCRRAGLEGKPADVGLRRGPGACGNRVLRVPRAPIRRAYRCSSDRGADARPRRLIKRAGPARFGSLFSPRLLASCGCNWPEGGESRGQARSAEHFGVYSGSEAAGCLKGLRIQFRGARFSSEQGRTFATNSRSVALEHSAGARPPGPRAGLR